MPCLNNGEPGNTTVTYSEEQEWLRMKRGPIVVVCNFSETETNLPPISHAREVLASRPGSRIDDRALQLQPESVVIIRTSS